MCEHVSIPGQGLHNVVYVATEHDSVYAFDADGGSSTPLWHARSSTLRRDHAGPGRPIRARRGDIPNEIGITGTPVIDPSDRTRSTSSRRPRR